MTDSLGWLEQTRAGQGAIRLCGMLDERLGLSCGMCGRSGSYALVRLIERFGPDAGLPAVRATLAGDRARLKAGRTYDRCKANFSPVPRRREER